MDTETKRLVATSAIQLFLGIGAWFFGWRIAKLQLDIRRSELRSQLFDDRYYVYQAFESFLQHCLYNEPHHPQALSEFQKNTVRVDFLFGQEIRKYRRQIIANALALRGIKEGLPCEDGVVVGGIVGYFKGSTNLKTVPEIQVWFGKQVLGELHAYFVPYLDYGSAGVDASRITMSPPNLPEPPLVRRPLRHSTTMTDEPRDAREDGVGG